MSIDLYIPFGKENAISRNRLCEITGMKDRQIRLEIAKARKASTGEFIVNFQEGEGYYRTRNKKEVRQWVAQETARIKNSMDSIEPARRYLGKGKAV